MKPLTLRSKKAKDEAFNDAVRAKHALREIIEPAKDTPAGVNANGDKLYDREDGTRYAMRHGRPDFGGDLAPAGATHADPGQAPEPATPAVVAQSRAEPADAQDAAAQQAEDKARQDDDVRQEADTDASEASYRELIAEMNAKIGERQMSFDADIVNLKSQHFRGTGVFKGLRSKKAKDEAFNDAVRELRLSNESDQKAILEEYRTKIDAHPYEAYRKAEDSRKTREMKAQMAADAARKAAQPITRADVTAAQQQAATLIAERIDAMTAGDVNTIARRFLPTMGVKPTISKERNKAAVTDFTKVNPMAAAAEFGVTLPAYVHRALDAEMQGKVADAGQDDGLAARADGDDDYLRTLFGGSDAAEQDAVSPAQAQKIDAKAAVPMLRKLAQDQSNRPNPTLT